MALASFADARCVWGQRERERERERGTLSEVHYRLPRGLERLVARAHRARNTPALSRSIEHEFVCFAGQLSLPRTRCKLAFALAAQLQA